MQRSAIFTAAGLVAFIIGCTIVFALRGPAPQVVVKNGTAITLERVLLVTNRITIESRPGPKLLRLLPQRFGGPQRVRHVVRPDFTNSSILCAALAIESAKPPSALRMVVSDDAGNRYDPIGHGAGVASYYWRVESSAAFPRRSEFINLRIMQSDNELASFRVKNPAYNPNFAQYAQLRLQDRNGGVTANVSELRSVFARRYDGQKHDTTSVVLKFQENGIVITNCEPFLVEIEDATGNHWLRVPKVLEQSEDSSQWSWMGGLWKTEEAWKLRVHTLKTSRFSPSEVANFEISTLPPTGEILLPNHTAAVEGGVLELNAIVAHDAPRNSVENINPNIWTRSGTVAIVFQPKVAEPLKMRVVSIVDSARQDVPVVEFRCPATMAEEKYMPYYVLIRTNEAVPPLTMTVAMTKPKTFEFIAPASHGTKE